MPKLYIIAGCNGAGKTTASYTVLPEMLGCKEFVNDMQTASGTLRRSTRRYATFGRSTTTVPADAEIKIIASGEKDATIHIEDTLSYEKDNE